MERSLAGREVGGRKKCRRTGVGRGECQVLFGVIRDKGSDFGDIFVSTRYRSKLWKKRVQRLCSLAGKRKEVTNGKSLEECGVG